MGNITIGIIGTVYYCTNDCFAFENGVNLRKTFMGYVISIKFTKEFINDIFDMCTMDAYI